MGEVWRKVWYGEGGKVKELSGCVVALHLHLRWKSAGTPVLVHGVPANRAFCILDLALNLAAVRPNLLEEEPCVVVRTLATLCTFLIEVNRS
jgi:hypothetical protein